MDLAITDSFSKLTMTSIVSRCCVVDTYPYCANMWGNFCGQTCPAECFCVLLCGRYCTILYGYISLPCIIDHLSLHLQILSKGRVDIHSKRDRLALSKSASKLVHISTDFVRCILHLFSILDSIKNSYGESL